MISRLMIFVILIAINAASLAQNGISTFYYKGGAQLNGFTEADTENLTVFRDGSFLGFESVSPVLDTYYSPGTDTLYLLLDTPLKTINFFDDQRAYGELHTVEWLSSTFGYALLNSTVQYDIMASWMSLLLRNHYHVAIGGLTFSNGDTVEINMQDAQHEISFDLYNHLGVPLSGARELV
jgi:hypothetical protein